MVTTPHADPPARGPTVKRVTGSPFDPLVKSLFPKIATHTPQFVTPNMVTVSGVAATMLAGAALALSRYAPWLLFVAAALLMFNWFTDTLDGVLARQRGQCSRLGDFLDHVFDAVTMAAVTIGIEYSGLAHPSIPLLVGVLFILGFVITYKGEQLTGVYELLTLGPTEIRFALVVFFVGCYFVTEPLVTVFGVGLRLMDVCALIGVVWSVVYDVVLIRRYHRLIAETEKPSRDGTGGDTAGPDVA
jgi:phosphatidylglycerophosphate synthase